MATRASAARSQPSADNAFPVKQLNSMAAPEMVKLWEQSFGDSPRCKSKPHLLRLLLAARLQGSNSSDRDGRVRRRITTLAAKFGRDPDHEPSANLGLRPGIELVRVWKGLAYRVHVLADGFIWNGRKHASLSVIAREITGTAWSGPAFFKLKRKADA